MTFLADTPTPAETTVDTLTADTAQRPAPRVEAIGDALYINGEKCCPFCFEAYGSEWCQCDLAAEFADAWPRGRDGSPLPPIHFDMRDGDQQ